MAEEVKLFRTKVSPFCVRVIWALKIKGIHFDSIIEDLYNKSSSLLHYNPVYKKVPVLLHNGKPVLESMVILEYIDDTWKENPLFPEDPYDRAMAKFWAIYGDEKVMPSIWDSFIKEGKEQEEAIVAAAEVLKFLEDELREKGKKFFGGEKIGPADLALGWLAYLVCVYEEIVGLKIIDGKRFPLLTEWMQEFKDAPILRENWPPHDQLLAKFSAIREKTLAAAPPKLFWSRTDG